MKAKLSDWELKNKKSDDLYDRAVKIETNKGLRQALIAYKRALQGDGDKGRESAKNKISAIEESLAENINKDIDKAIELGDNSKIIGLVKELKTLADSSRASKPKQILKSRRLPLTLAVDHEHTVVNVTDDGRDTLLKAPDGHTGPWKQTVHFLAMGQISIKASRPGFANYAKVHKINENDIETLTNLEIHLNRGPLWIAQLDGKPVTTPVLAGSLVLVGTNKNTLAMVNAVGKTSPIDLKADVAVFSGTPLVFNRVAYSIIGDRIYAVDLNTRSLLWTYPDDNAAEFPGQFVQSLWVQEHEHKVGELQVLVGTSEGKLIVLEVSKDNQITAYPKSDIGWAATAAPLGFSHDNFHGVLYLPAGPRVVTFDISTATAEEPMEQIYTVTTRGDILCRPSFATVAGNKAILLTDSSGNMTAINADPDSQRGNQDALGSWPLEGGAIYPPVVIEDSHVAIVGLSEGVVIALDLNKPGTILWRFPDQANLGSINGPPAIGKNGVYVADSTGNLNCIDIKTGKQIWQVDLLSAANTGVLAHEGRIYVGTRAGSLLCFEEGSH